MRLETTQTEDGEMRGFQVALASLSIGVALGVVVAFACMSRWQLDSWGASARLPVRMDRLTGRVEVMEASGTAPAYQFYWRTVQ